MGPTLGSLFINSIYIITTFIVIILTYFFWAFGYWKRRNVPYIEPSIPFGTAKNVFLQKVSHADYWKNIYLEFKRRKVRYGGIYQLTAPHYVPIDLNIVKHIMQNDFAHFVNHGIYVNEKDDPLTGHLVFLEDAKWRNLRVKLTPTFTSGKMKMMFPTLVNCTEGLKEILNDYSERNEVVEIKSILQRFTMDIIGSCAFGIDCNCLKDPDTEFMRLGKKVFDLSMLDIAKMFCTFVVPRRILHALKFKMIKPELTHFFLELVKNVVKYREENNIYRRDFLHLLLQLKNRGVVTDDEKLFDESGKSKEVGLNMNQLAAQVFVFFIAGFETSSTNMTFAIYELAANPDIQEKARQEVNRVIEKHEGKLSYDAIMDMKYLERVLNETLRKYPPFPQISSQCNKDYRIPDSDLLIKKGIRVNIPVLGIHHDPEYYPDPDKFDPERFTEENKAKRPHYSWIPFGEGPRICIGLRFAMMQSKVGLAVILKHYKITLNRKTELPIRYGKRNFISSIEGDLWVNFEKL